MHSGAERLAAASPRPTHPGQPHLGSPVTSGGSEGSGPAPENKPAPAPAPDSAPAAGPASAEPPVRKPRGLRSRKAPAPAAEKTPAPAASEPATPAVPDSADASASAPEPAAPAVPAWPKPAATPPAALDPEPDDDYESFSPPPPPARPATPEPDADPGGEPAAHRRTPSPAFEPVPGWEPLLPTSGTPDVPYDPDEDDAGSAPSWGGPTVGTPPPSPGTPPPATPATSPAPDDSDTESGWRKFLRRAGFVAASPFIATAWGVNRAAQGIGKGTRYVHSRLSTPDLLAQPLYQPAGGHTVAEEASVYVIGNEHPEQQAKQLSKATIRRWYREKTEPDLNTPIRRKDGPGAIRRWVDKAAIHAMEAMYGGRLERGAEDILRSTDDMLALPKAPARRKNYNSDHVDHARIGETQANKIAQAEGIAEQYRGGFNYGHHQLGENVLAVHKGGQFFQDFMTELVEPLVIGGEDLTRPEVQAIVRRLVRRHEERDPVLQQVLRSDSRNIDQRMLADNIYDRAIKQREHAAAYRDTTNPRTLVDEVELVFADLKGGARSEVKKTRGVDTMIGFIQDKMRGAINATTLATGSALSILVTERGLSAITRLTDTTTFYLTEYFGHGIPAYIAVPAAIAGAFSLLRGRREANVDRALHNREDANGATFDPKSPGRAKMQRRVVHEGETAAKYISNSRVQLSKTATMERPGLQARIEAVSTNQGSQDAKQQLIHLIGEIMARRNLSDLDKKKSDTFRSDEFWTIDQGDHRLRAKIREGLTLLENTMSPDDINNALTDSVKHWEREIRKKIKKQDRRFALRAWGDSAVKGLITATTAFATGEAMRAAWWGVHELFRGSTVSDNLAAGKQAQVDGVTMQADPSGKITFNGGAGPQPEVYYQDGTLITTEDLSQVSPQLVREMHQQGYTVHAALPETPAYIDPNAAGANIQLDHGMKLVPGANGTFEIQNAADNSVLADNVRIDSQTGDVTLHQTSNLISVETTPGTDKVITVTNGVDRETFFASYTSHVEHQSYGNEPWEIDANENGVRNERIGNDGVRWYLNMTDNGSWNGRVPESVNPNNLAAHDEVYWYAYDKRLPVDAPGGRNHGFVIKANETNGAFHLVQSASQDTMITVMMDGNPVQMSEADLAKASFKADLGDYVRNSNFTDKEGYFNFDFSPVTYQQIDGKWTVGHLATSPGTGVGDITAEITDTVSTTDTTVKGANIIEIPLDKNDADFGLPIPHSERKPMGRVINLPYSRYGHDSAPDGGNPSSAREGGSSRAFSAIRAIHSTGEATSQMSERGKLQEYFRGAEKRGLSFDDAYGIYKDVQRITNQSASEYPPISDALMTSMRRHVIALFRGQYTGDIVNAYLRYRDASRFKEQYDWQTELTNFAHAYITYESIHGANEQTAAAA